MNTLRSLTPHRYRSRHSGATRGSGLSRIVCLVALLVTFAASVRAQYPITTSSFPDKNFYSAVLKNKYYMFDGTYYLTLPGLQAMDVKSCNIADLTGIGLFPFLQTLDCSNNQLTSVDLSYNANLTTVTIYKNKLRGTYMDNFISKLPKVSDSELRIIYNEDASTGNQMTTDQVAAAKKKGWTPRQSTNGTTWTDYPGVVLINSKNFPDSKFQAWLKKQTYGQDGVLTDAEIAGVTSINVWWKDISDLTGINYFTALTELKCGGNQLTNLDVSGCTALTELDCSDNQLTNLDVSGCTALTELECGGNQLTDLDVSKNTALTKLNCGGNQLTDLDVSKNTALTKLWCNSNQLTDLNVSGCTALTELYCSENELTDLDVSGCTALTRLEGYSNQLTNLNVSKNTALTQLDCGDNQLTDLDVSKNTALTKLWCNSNQLTDLDVTKNTALTALYCYCNELTNLDVSGCTTLTKLYCYKNQLNGAAVGKLIKSLPKTAEGELRFIDKSETPDGNEITTAQVAAAKAKRWTTYYWNNSNYDWLEYEGIDAIAIDETNFPDSKFQAWLKTQTYGQDGVLTPSEIAGVTSIDVSYRSISDLTGINYFTALTKLYCLNNELTNLDVSGCTELTLLFCYSNQLTDLDVSKNTKLTKLYCYDNQLTNLDVTKNTALTNLDCASNQLTDLDVTKNTKLTKLNCYDNQLTTLDVSKNTALTYLDCGGNQLTDLDVSKNTALTVLGCYNNQLHGAAVSKLINSLPETTEAELYFIDNSETPDGNEITTAQVAAAKKEKGWTTYYYDGSNWQPYEGIDAIAIDETNFPDENFRKWLLEQDYGQDGVLTDAEIAGVTSIDVSNRSISDLTGINYFTALTELDCSGNQLRALDVSKNTALRYLSCFNNLLTELNLEKNTALTYLYCGNNQLTELDLTNNTKIKLLSIYSNRIRGTAMDRLIESLPKIKGYFYVVIPNSETEGNTITILQIYTVKEKGWETRDYVGAAYNGVTIPGDFNGDGEVNAQDIDCLRDHILGLSSATPFFKEADLNGDGKADITDLTKLIEKMKE